MSSKIPNYLNEKHMLVVGTEAYIGKSAKNYNINKTYVISFLRKTINLKKAFLLWKDSFLEEIQTQDMLEAKKTTANITDEIRKLLKFKFKKRFDSITDQFNRVYMTSALLAAAFLTGLDW